MNRRSFLSLSCFSAASYSVASIIPPSVLAQPASYLMSVNGKIYPSAIQNALAHEHMITDFTGAEKITQPQYQRKDAFEHLLPYLKTLKTRKVNLLVECTPAYIGRDVELLKQLSQASGIHILTNTGYYSAVGFKYLPQHAFTESSDTIAERWLKEWTKGIDGTGIRPGFIKLGTDAGPLKPVAEKLITAAAQVHLKSGLKIAIHTGDPEAALAEQSLLEAQGIHPDAFIWVHAQNDHSGDTQVALAKKGCWISLDGINQKEDSLSKYVNQITRLRNENLLHRVLISQDDGFAVNNHQGKIQLEAYANGNSQPYNSLFTHLQPRLKSAGLTDSEFKTLIAKNPVEAYQIKICKI